MAPFYSIIIHSSAMTSRTRFDEKSRRGIEVKKKDPRGTGRSIEEEMVKVSEGRTQDRKRGREEEREEHGQGDQI